MTMRADPRAVLRTPDYARLLVLATLRPGLLVSPLLRGPVCGWP
jgi:hypothetical protein